MNSLTVGLVSTGCIFCGALLGVWLQRRLPGHHLSNEMQDLVKVSAGTIATLTALVLGLLVSSAKSSFDTINADIVHAGAKLILMDRALARYGPEAKPVREQLKRLVGARVEMVWPSKRTGASSLTTFEGANGMEVIEDKLRELTPKNDTQRQFLAQAQQMAGDLGQSRWLVIEESQVELPLPLLVILVLWLVLLFVSFGLFAPRNAMALAVLLVGSCSISAAIFLVLELNKPLEGLIKVSDAPLRNALSHMAE